MNLIKTTKTSICNTKHTNDTKFVFQTSNFSPPKYFSKLDIHPNQNFCLFSWSAFGGPRNLVYIYIYIYTCVEREREREREILLASRAMRTARDLRVRRMGWPRGQYIMSYCIVLYYSIVQCSTVQYSIVQYSIVQCSMVYCVLQYSLVQYSIV